MDILKEFLSTTGFASLEWGNVIMILIGGALLKVLEIKRERLACFPCGFSDCRQRPRRPSVVKVSRSPYSR